MANTVSNHLFELIKSLTKSEKRYFKLYSSRHTIGDDNNYCLLFDYIEKMEVYNEESIFNHFKGETFLNKFSISKGRLYQYILKSLDLFYSDSSIDSEIYTMIHQADILFNKGLYSLSEKILNSAEKMAEKNEKNILLLSIKESKKKLIENTSYSTIKIEEIKEIEKEEKEIIQNITIHQQIWMQKSMLFCEINSIGNSNLKTTKEKLNQIYNDINQLKTNNIKSNFIKQHTISAYYFYTGQFEKGFELLENNYSLIETNKALFKNENNYYFSILSNLVYIGTKIKLFEKAKFYMHKLKSFEADFINQIDLKIKYFSSLTSLELSLIIEENEYTNAKQTIKQIEEKLIIYESKISLIRRVYIEFKISIILLSMGEYSESLKWNVKILNDAQIDKQQDIFCVSQFVHLILHYELNHYDYLPYAIQSVKRYLKVRNYHYQFENLFLKAFTKIAKEEINHFDVEEILFNMKKEYKELKNNENEKAFLEFFDFLTWMDSKIEKKKFLDLKYVS